VFAPKCKLGSFIWRQERRRLRLVCSPALLIGEDEQRSRRVNGIYMLSSQRKSGMVPVGNQQMAMNGKLKAEDLP
jgi:hypothetical protein